MTASTVSNGLTTGDGDLSLDALIQQVLDRNPSLAQMTAAWQAAAARYPQVTSLDDPMFNSMLGPASFNSNQVDGAYRLELSQKLPFPGKRALRGESAQSEANAAAHEVEDMRLQLIESAKDAFYDYYLVERAINVNDESLRLLREIRESALRHSVEPKVTQHDVLQADVETGRQQERLLMLERMRKVAIARINTLMHLPPGGPLPPPPQALALGKPLPPVDALRAQAIAQRPDLQALSERIAAERSNLALACREFYPDFEVTAAYDAFWQEKDLRPMIGLNMNVPIRKARRWGAVEEARARIAQREAQLDARTDQLNLQVQEAYERLLESEKVVRLYEQAILPAARQNIDVAPGAYASGQIPFLSLLEDHRDLVGLQERYYESLAEYFRRRATLERAVGGPLETPQ